MYKLGIFKNKESDIFGFCFKPKNKNYDFIFTTNINIFKDVLDDDNYIKNGTLFIKEYINENEILEIKKQFTNNDIIIYVEIYFLKEFELKLKKIIINIIIIN